MAFKVLKRAINALVLFFATVAFFRVPIGEKTGFEHAVAIFSTPPAKEAGRSIADVSHRIVEDLAKEVERLEKHVPEG